MRYNPFFENLIRGRQQEFLVYSEIYRASERLFGELNVNIYDQIADIDGIDFLIRVETEGEVKYIEGQVKKTFGGLPYATKGNSLQQLVEKANRRDSCLLVFAVDYDRKSNGFNGIHFYAARELEDAYRELSRTSLNLGKLNERVGRDTSVSSLAGFLQQMFE